VQPQANIQQLTPDITELAYQRAPLSYQSSGWKSVTIAMKVPMEPHGDFPQSEMIRYFSGVVEGSYGSSTSTS
jgi:hypothetical protein